MKGNLRIQVNAFLQDTYNVFNLSKKEQGIDARNNIKIDIIPGKSYVENSEASIVHAGESPYKEFEGILPVLQEEDEEWDISKYGPTLYNKLKHYFEDDSQAAQDELWSTDTSYKNYTNQYDIVTNWAKQPYNGTEKYLSYGGMEEALQGKKSVSYTLGSIDGDNNGLYANIRLIHFSKYYNVYSSKRSQAPLLHSLVYDYDSLLSYNMDVTEEGIPYINTLITYRAFRGGRGAHMTDETLRIYRKKVYYNTDNEYPYDLYQSGEDFDNEFEGDGPVSQFKTNRNKYPTYYEGRDEEWDNYVPQGFSLFGITWESSIEMSFNDSNGHDIHQANKTLPGTWRANFDCAEDYKYSFSRPNDHYIANSNTNQTILGLWYKGDEAGNVHILNNYFVCPVKTGQEKSQYISDRILAAKNKTFPATIGLAVASVLANIYVYSGTDTQDIKYVSDIIYLAPNDTLYTKDMVYKAYVNLPENLPHNDVLNFKGVDYSQYLNRVKTRVFGNITDTDIKKRLNDNNVNAFIKGCIKNHPIQVKIQYQDPSLDDLNRADSVVAVKGVDGKVKSVIFDGLQPNIMYQVQDTENGITIQELGKSFQIRYLEKLELNEDYRTLTPTWSNKIPLETASDLIKAFKIADNRLICSEWRSTGAKSRYYSITGDFYTTVALVDLLKDDVLIPFAKMWQ